MKPNLAALLSFAVLTSAASGRLFDTPEELRQRLDGNAFQSESPGFFPFENDKRGTICQIQVVAFFFKARCLQISYHPPASDAVIDLILEKNRGNSSWTKQDDQTWIRADGAAFARLQDTKLLIVSTELAPDWQALQEGRFTDGLIKSALEKL
jgi:hypothetical protein